MALFIVHDVTESGRHSSGVQGGVIDSDSALNARAKLVALHPQFADTSAYAVVQITASAGFSAGLAEAPTGVILIEGRMLTSGKLTRGGNFIKL